MRTIQKQNFIRWAVLAGVICLVSILQNTRGLLPAVFGVNAVPLIPLVVCISMFEREMAGAFFGLFAGALWDITAIRGEGFHAVFLLLAGCACGLLLSHVMRNNFVTAMVLTAGILLLHNLLYWLFFFVFTGVPGSMHILIRWYLPSALYTFLLLPAVYFPLRFAQKHLRRKKAA